ncbi:oligosaccharide flippase family protein [Demequina iriomotensis]|uniref:oligosaccharide flippase family protein n=1 Tax=Demequina iriomotensis TaxID=1536641 RepID=UPI0007816B6B|nr:oligosaccharide flippase family protein [Demequina iriomotensis]
MAAPRGASARRDVFATVLSSGLAIGAQFVAMAVLGRVLGPAEFGSVAVATAIAALVQTILYMGLPEVEIQLHELSRRLHSTLWWVNVGVGLGLGVIVASSASAISGFYGEPDLASALMLVAFAPVLLGTHVQSRVALIRLGRLRALAWCEVSAGVVAATVGVVLGLAGAGYWSVVAIPVTQALVVSVAVIAVAGWRPGRPGRLGDARDVLANGARMFGVQTLRNSGRLMLVPAVATALPSHAVGLLDRAQQFATVPVTSVLSQLSRVAVPRLARDSGAELSRRWLRVHLAVTAGSAVMFLLLAVLADPVVMLVLGNGWNEAVPLLQILALASLARASALSSDWVLAASGRYAVLLRFNVIAQPLVLAFGVLGLFGGVRGVAIGTCAGAWIATVVQLAVTARIVGTSQWTLWRDTAIAILGIGAPAAGCAALVSSQVDGVLPTLGAALAAPIVIACALVLGIAPLREYAMSKVGRQAGGRSSI